MNTSSTMTKTKVQEVMADMEKAMKELEAKHGVKISRAGNVRYSDVDFNAKFKVEIANSSVVEDREQEKFEQLARMKNFNPNGFGETFENNGLTLKIVGCNSRASKNPIVLEDQDGKKYKMSLVAYNNMFPMK